MDFDLNEEDAAFQQVVREFARKEIAPRAEQWDRDARLPVEVIHQMGDLGLFGLVFPPEWGGSGGSFTAFCLAVEEIGWADQSVGITLSAGVGLGAVPIYRFGNNAQRSAWLPDLVTGRALAAFGLTEPDGGSDAGALRTRVRDDPDGWVLDGAKAFITNSGSPITSVITVTARHAHGGVSAFLVPAGTPGLHVEPAYRKLGWHASDTHGLVLADCAIPRENLLGQEGAGYRNFLATLDDGRISIAALALGCARACLDAASDYARTRNAFGGPIGRFQAVAFSLADMATALEAARGLVLRAAWLKDHARPYKQAAAMAKLYATETAVSATRAATQIFGGAGFLEENPVARFYRDAKVLEIGEGTSEVQRLVIAKGLELPVT
ncbi:MAG: acyl-CoA dehydrogenase family protein [Acidimicrobiales bacterium]